MPNKGTLVVLIQIYMNKLFWILVFLWVPGITIFLFFLCILFLKVSIHFLSYFPAPKPDLSAAEKKAFPLKAEEKMKGAGAAWW